MFINCSNHNSKNWSAEQLQAASLWGEIIDYPFPAVSAGASHEDVLLLAEKSVKEILEYHPDCVMCQGEFTLTCSMVCLLKEAGVKVVAGCSERNVREQQREDGTTEKTAVYQFVQFREY